MSGSRDALLRAHAEAWGGHVAEQIVTECDRQGVAVAELVRELGYPPRYTRFLLVEPARITVDLIGRSCEALGLDVGAVVEAAFADAGPMPSPASRASVVTA